MLVFGYESKDDAAKHAAQRAKEEAAAAPAEKKVEKKAEEAPKAEAAAAAAAAPAAAGEVIELHAPIEGTAVALADVPDPIFAAGKLGEGVAIEPTGTTVAAPAAGKVAATYPLSLIHI